MRSCSSTYCKIIAPLSGRIGLRQVDQGNMVHANDATGIAVITQVQPISVLFSIPEDNLQDVLKKLRSDTRLPVEPSTEPAAKSSPRALS